MFKIEVIGNIGADAVIKNENGNEFVAFNVAHSEKRGDKDYTQWFSVTTGNKKIAQYLLKGTKVYVRGNANVSVYKNQQGVSVVGISIFANEIEFCGGGNKENVQQNAPLPNIAGQNNGGGDGKKEDMPF